MFSILEGNVSVLLSYLTEVFAWAYHTGIPLWQHVNRYLLLSWIKVCFCVRGVWPYWGLPWPTLASNLGTVFSYDRKYIFRKKRLTGAKMTFQMFRFMAFFEMLCTVVYCWGTVCMFVWKSYFGGFDLYLRMRVAAAEKNSQKALSTFRKNWAQLLSKLSAEKRSDIDAK